MGAQQRLLSRRQVATSQAYLAHLIQGQPGSPGDVSPQLGGGQARLGLCLRPRAMQPLDVRSEQATHARKAVDALAFAPSVLCLRPFKSASHVADRDAGLDRGAEDAAGHRRCELAADGSYRRFVGERKSLLDVSLGQ